MRRFNALVLVLGGAVLGPGTARAQFGRGAPEWMTAGGDPQRSSWIRSDPKISVEKLQKPGFGLAWKIKLSGEPAIAPTLDRYIGYRGFRSYAFTNNAAGELTTIDSDLGRVEWQKKLAGGSGQSSAGCPGGMTANLARSTSAAFPTAPAGRGGGGGGGRGGPAKSAVGEAGEGAVTIAAAAAANADGGGRGRGGAGGRGAAPGPGGPGGPGAPGAPGRGAPGGGGGFGRMPSFLNVLSPDGMFHSLYVSNGEEPTPPVAFVPAGANARQLTVLESAAYVATSQGCGGAPNAVWSLDLTSKQVVHWNPTADIAAGGFAMGPDNTVYVATTAGDLVGLDGKSLQVKGVYRATNQSFSASPVIFESKDKAMIAVPSKEGQIYLVDPASFTGTAFPGAATGPLASWQDSSGARWIVAPSSSAIAAWKVSDQGSLQPGWTSSDMGTPVSVLIVDGVVFAASNSPNAVLHALDGSTGKELWNSAKIMTAAVRTGALSGSSSQLYLGTSDGTIYAFGFPIEH